MPPCSELSEKRQVFDAQFFFLKIIMLSFINILHRTTNDDKYTHFLLEICNSQTFYLL